MGTSNYGGLSSSSVTYSALVRLSDEQVMSWLAQGNHDALAVVFDRYQRLVTRVALQILRDSAEAEDVMQSVFIAILESANKFSAERGTVRVWILQHAYHQALNRRRYLSLRGAYDAPNGDTEFRQDLDHGRGGARASRLRGERRRRDINAEGYARGERRASRGGLR